MATFPAIVVTLPTHVVCAKENRGEIKRARLTHSRIRVAGGERETLRQATCAVGRNRVDSRDPQTEWGSRANDLSGSTRLWMTSEQHASRHSNRKNTHNAGIATCRTQRTSITERTESSSATLLLRRRCPLKLHALTQTWGLDATWRRWVRTGKEFFRRVCATLSQRQLSQQYTYAD